MPGIDLGTTRTKAAIVNAARKPEIVPNARGEHHTDSYVHVTEDPLVGTDAREQGFVEPAKSVSNFKLKLGQTTSLLNNGRVFTPTDAAATVISRIKGDIERVKNRELTDCVATCPANFRDDQKQALIEAFTRNNLKVLLLLPEPTAAGIAYAMNKSGSTLHIAVYDFGGGTLDVSILRVEGNQINVLATEGVAKLGGNDINAALRGYVLSEVTRRGGATPPIQDPLFEMDLEAKIENAKLSLGGRPEVPVVVNLSGNSAIIPVRQDQFHAMIDPLLKQSLDALDRALDAASLRKEELHDVIMVGGTSRLPYIQQSLAKHIGRPPKTDIDPDKAVVYGAAIAYQLELAKRGRHDSHNDVVIPPPDLFVRDVTAHAVGCCVIDVNGQGRRMLNAAILNKNTPIPCCKVDRFFLERDDQSSAQIEILQGEPDAERDQCLLIGELLLENLPPEPKRTARIQVEYSIDSNGMVTATATDLVGGTSKTVTVDYKKGVKPKDKPPRF